ncbi:aldo/keto reductase [Flavobacteriaceae bacterium]|nr:aldo/keto reductase [Flavobacteriaceae bacterium]MDA9015675.1 aldo/keto reductase [Flavobacteriaceae bacterium]MDC3354590.1 aldo/keto reductase [Flavobacteriaceae bacterium]
MNPFSRIISGTMTWGAWGAQMSTSQMQAQIEKYFALGITTFDHADIYGGYTTEAEFGAGFAQSNVAREEVQFITKCGIQMPCQARPLPVKHYDYSAQHIQKSVENSLSALNTDYIDLLLLHRPSPLLDLEIVTETIQKLQHQGKIKAFGVSNFTPSQIALLEKEIKVSWNQIECSLTHEIPMFDGTLDFMATQSIGAMSWSPLGSYFKENNSQTARIKKCMNSLCEKYNCSEDQLLLSWLVSHPSKIYPVVGTTSIQRIENAIGALRIEIELTDWFLLLEASQGNEVP